MNKYVLTTALILAGTVPMTVAAAPFAQSSSGSYEISRDLNDTPGDSGAVKAARANLRSAFDQYGRDLDSHKIHHTDAAGKAEAHRVLEAQRTLHQALGDYQQQRWDAYAKNHDVWQDRHNYDVNRFEHDMAANRQSADRDFLRIRNDQKAQASDSAEVTRDRENLKSATAALDQAKKQYGANSAQVKDAAAKVTQAETNLHRDLGDLERVQSGLKQQEEYLLRDRGYYSTDGQLANRNHVKHE